jgi:hypothetical protein
MKPTVAVFVALSGLLLLTLAPRVTSAEAPPSLPEPSARPATRPTTLPTIAQAVERGVAYLVKTQNQDGSWGTGRETRGFEVYSMVPGSHDAFRVATTALGVMALREAEGSPHAKNVKGVKEAHDRALEYLLTHGEARRDDGALLYNIWAHIYGLQAIAEEMQHGRRDDPRLRSAAVFHLKRLGQYETFMGGWNYYDFDAHTERPSMGPTSFGTSAGLVALWEAKQAGIDIPQKMVDLSLKRLAEMRLPNGAYLYGTDYKYIPRLPANQPRGSVGRTQAGNYALWIWNAGGIDKPKVYQGLDFFFKEHDYIEMGRQRQFPHESWYQTAPYYYYFGHYYTARLLEKLGEPGRERYGQKLADNGILPYQEPDGSWWDFAMWDYHKPYGTAFAVMTLLRCERTPPPSIKK